MEHAPLFIVHLVGFAAFLWLGLYAFVHGDGRGSALIMAGAALTTALFFLSGGLLMLETNATYTVLLHRLTWWPDVLPTALWFHLSVLLGRRAGWAVRSVKPMYAVAALLIVLGTTTDTVLSYKRSPVVAGPLYVAYVVYVVVAVGVAMLNLLGGRGRGHGVMGDVTERKVDGSGDIGLAVGSFFFLAGGGYLALKVLGRDTAWPEFPAYLLLLAGLVPVGVAIAARGALLLGKDVRRDLLSSCTGLSCILLIYLLADGLLVGFASPSRGVFSLLLAGLVTAGYTLPDLGYTLWDRVFLASAVREERGAARSYADALAIAPSGSHPDLSSPKKFDDAVRRALTHLSDPTKLATSPLLNLAVVRRGLGEETEDNRLSRATALRGTLLELLDSLKPADASQMTGDAARYYNCLYYPYVRGLNRQRAYTTLRQLKVRRQREESAPSEFEVVLEWLGEIPEDTFYKWQRRGSDTIAAALREREAGAGGIVPDDPSAALSL